MTDPSVAAGRTSLFEVSWEVCNKVGGIHAVVSSKAASAVGAFGGRYWLLGPDLGSNPGFVETDEAEWDVLRRAVGLKGLRCRFGRWEIPGRPKVILVGFRNRFHQDQLLYELWNRYGVDSMTGGWDYVEPVMFSTACGEVIAAVHLALVEPEGGASVAHFHEWMCGGGLLSVKRYAPGVATVFTTHATMLGRAMAGSGCDIYAGLEGFDPLREAANRNIAAKCSMERVSAREADCFTTVSRITADEAAVFLGRTPDVLTLNGLDLRAIPDRSADRSVPEADRAGLLAAAGRLLRTELPARTRIVAVSGRYEFRNKGVDVFLDAMAEANRALRGSGTRVLALVAVMGGHAGVDADAVSGRPDVRPSYGPRFIASHHVHDAPHDAILGACARLGLGNGPDDPVQVVFVPALLDGRDGFLDMSYEEVIAACDLGVFPSWYEPWGYTPQEAAAWAVPTLTTDLSGFGLWMRERSSAGMEETGIGIVPRRRTPREAVVASLRDAVLRLAAMPDDGLLRLRAAARRSAEACTWERFFPRYLEAYAMASERAVARTAPHADGGRFLRVLAGRSSATPVLHAVTATARLPEALSGLHGLSRNLWWCWQPDAADLFASVDPEAWARCGHNPVTMLAEADRDRLDALAGDEGFRQRLGAVLARFEAYMAEPPRTGLKGGLSPSSPIAYFSAEYGIAESLPIYSGGLGVLSGDHLKSASDLNLPLVAVGLLYRSGYFRQTLDGSGRQVAAYPQNDFAMLPLERVRNAEGKVLHVRLGLPGRELVAQAWLVRVGRVRLYLLDADLPQNTSEDRRITARLYEADRDCRLRQEILLGMGGVRLLEELGLLPAVWHMNEGHSAFLVLERIRSLMERSGLSFAAARELVRGSCVFTTHTPVPAGNECFAPDLMDRYFGGYASSVGLSRDEFMRLGRVDGQGRDVFEMTVLALNHAFTSNGVSRLHGEVSRRMWHGLWKGVPVAEVPIGHVTNGVHAASYAGPAVRRLIEGALGAGWTSLPPDSPAWRKLRDLPDDALWAARREQKAELLAELRRRLPDLCRRLSVPRDVRKAMEAGLDPDALVIGFARRFAPYKRANLLFADPGRLERILSDPKRPVVVVFAGKAHPADGQGCDILQEIVKRTISPQFAGKAYFMENYDLAASRLLVRGCDVWLNTPRRPHEASGTSGMKLSVSGGLNVSVADGWWCEGYDGGNGWTIGSVGGRLSDIPEQGDYRDAESLYMVLEEQVVPMWCERGEDGLPHRWLAMAKRAMAELTPRFSSDRMVAEYLSGRYEPTAEHHRRLVASDCALARTLARWRRTRSGLFQGVRIEEVRLDGLDGDSIPCGTSLSVGVTLVAGGMDRDDLVVQFVIGPGEGDDFRDVPVSVDLSLSGDDGAGRLTYSGTYAIPCGGRYVYGVRVMAGTAGLASPIDSGLVLWA